MSTPPDLLRSRRAGSAGGALDTDDVLALGDAAWWIGDIHEALRLSEECYERYLAEGRPDRAATVALETAFNWFLRGQPEVGSGWLSRGRRLLSSLPEGPGHGFLMAIEAGELARAGELERAVEVAGRMLDLGESLEDPGIRAHALALEGTLLIRQGDLGRGYELLDEAMLPVLAGRIRPDMAGNLYCQMMSVCHDLGDAVRARRWTDVTQRWCETFASAVMFVGICRVHRTQLLRLEGDWDRAASSQVIENLELPGATFLYTVSLMHCMTVSLAQGGAGLGTAWGRQLAEQMLRDAGFSSVETRTIDTDPFNVYYVANRLIDRVDR